MHYKIGEVIAARSILMCDYVDVVPNIFVDNTLIDGQYCKAEYVNEAKGIWNQWCMGKYGIFP